MKFVLGFFVAFLFLFSGNAFANEQQPAFLDDSRVLGSDGYASNAEESSVYFLRELGSNAKRFRPSGY